MSLFRVDRHRSTIPLDDVLDAPPASVSEIGVWAAVLGVQIGSGVPILEAVDVTYTATDSSVLQELAFRVYGAVLNGEAVAHGFAAMPTAFAEDAALGDKLKVSVERGEECGHLDTQLLAFAEEHARTTFADVHRSLGVTEFTIRFLSALTEALVEHRTIARSLGALYTRAEASMKPLARELFDGVSRGLSLYETLERRVELFGRLIPAVVRAGEAGGALPVVLGRIVRSSR